MKCPKCRYLSFEPELRCKHCGFDFSLADPAPASPAFDELEQQNPDVPVVDIQLRDAAAERASAGALLDAPDLRPAAEPARPRPIAAARLRGEPDLNPARAASARVRPAFMPASSASSAPTPDLPLFIKGTAVPAPALPRATALAVKAPVGPAPASAPAPAVRLAKPALTTDPADDHKDEGVEFEKIEVPVAPRPLAVRRRAPDSGRVATMAPAAPGLLAAPMAAVSQPAANTLIAAATLPRADRDVLEYVRRVEHEAAPAARPSDDAIDRPDLTMLRAKAAAVDLIILLALNSTIVLLTLRECGLDLEGLRVIPVLPMATFLVSLSLTYLLAFTVAGGQTIGKMIFGLRVVGEADASGEAFAPTARQLSLRAMLSVASTLLLGLGFLPAILGDGRALHDRMTQTRLVRV